MTKTAAELSELLAGFPEDAPASTQTRLYRAVRWLARAELETDDADVKFILLWICFNALYADDIGSYEETFRGQNRRFLDQLIDLDEAGALHSLIWTTYSNSVRTLLDNHYAYAGFWKHVSNRDVNADWQDYFRRDNARALDGLKLGYTATVLEVVYERLYTIRNQLVHGGSTHNSSLNRHQVTDGARILASTVPVMLEIMIKNPREDYGEIMYPIVD